jgi:hypothetical protein
MNIAVASPPARQVLNTEMTFMRSLKTIEQISRLKDNWNHNGAPAFSPDLIRLVRRIVALLPVQPEIFPTACNSIQLEYGNEIKEYLEFEVNTSKIIAFMVDAKGQESEIMLRIDDQAKINELVVDFHGHSF